jgi:Asp-tRNA(Asn)/Glu-tRNA(Gln) amidotransferase B subunit
VRGPSSNPVLPKTRQTKQKETRTKTTKTKTKTKQWNIMEDPEIKPCNYRHLIFDKGPKRHTLEKRQPIQQMVLGKLAIYLQKIKTRPLSLTCTKTNSKWVKNFNVRPNTLTLLQVTLVKTLGDTDIGNYFLNRIPVDQEMRA